MATIIVTLAGALGVEPVRAGTYEMFNCSAPGHGPSLLHPWSPYDSPGPSVTIVDACSAGGGLGITVGGTRQLSGGRVGGINLQPPIGPRSQIKFVKLKLWYATRLAGAGQALHFWSGDLRSDGSVHTALGYGPPGSENLVTEQQLSPDTTSVEIGIHCGPGGGVSPEPCVPAHDVPLLIRGVEVTLSEDVQPIVLPPGGTLLEAGPQSGIRTVSYSATDAQSGLSKVEVLLDETVVASHDVTPRCPHGDFTVCPDSLDETLQVDTRAVSNGPHRLKLRVQDAAGNERVVHWEQPVEVVNEPPAGSTPAFSVIAKINGTSRTTVTVPFGRRVVVRGRLAQASQPVGAGVPLEVLERLDRKGAREQVASRVETNAGGSFTAVVATNRPSRVVRLSYRSADGNRTVSRALKVRVRAASRLRAALRGRVVRFSGRVLSEPIAKRGKRVLMEGRSPGSAWTQFKNLRSDKRGRFSGTYRLRVRRPGVVLKIRAVVPSESGYGYVSSRSRAVSLRVR